MKTTRHILTGLKGFAMGAANVVPGVSGGTIALLTGIYTDIVDAIDSLTCPATWKALLGGRFKEFWQRIKGGFLLALGIGLVISILSLAKLMTYVLDWYPIPTWAFFFGLIVASAVVMFRDVEGWGVREVILTIAGAALGVAVCTMSPTRTPDDMWFIFICGAISVCTMILPGISGSFILLILCKYDYIMQALSDLNWPVLAVFGLGCIVGILAFAKLLHWLLGRWEKQTMLVLLGFVLGSLVKVWPWSDISKAVEAQVLRDGVGTFSSLDLQIPSAIIWCVAGIALVAVLERLGSKASSES